jgi:hypothetical protein
MQVQGQVRDAGAVAAELRREADKLRAAAEEAELEMAAAASMRDQRKPGASHNREALTADNGYTSQTVGYGHQSMLSQGQGGPPVYGQAPQAYGQVQQQGYGYGQPPAGYGQPAAAPHYGQMPPSAAGNGAMGVGGASYDIPAPESFW